MLGQYSTTYVDEKVMKEDVVLLSDIGREVAKTKQSLRMRDKDTIVMEGEFED